MKRGDSTRHWLVEVVGIIDEGRAHIVEDEWSVGADQDRDSSDTPSGSCAALGIHSDICRNNDAETT